MQGRRAAVAEEVERNAGHPGAALQSHDHRPLSFGQGVFAQVRAVVAGRQQQRHHGRGRERQGPLHLIIYVHGAHRPPPALFVPKFQPRRMPLSQMQVTPE